MNSYFDVLRAYPKLSFEVLKNATDKGFLCFFRSARKQIDLQNGIPIGSVSWINKIITTQRDESMEAFFRRESKGFNNTQV